MLALVAVLSFVIALVLHQGNGGEFLVDAASWALIGLAFFAASHLWDRRPWANNA